MRRWPQSRADWPSSPRRRGRTPSTADWCADDGRTFSIRGPAITTPGGHAIEGNYARHSFFYVVPDGEADAGHSVAMLLLNENEVKVQAGAGTKIWLRCKPAIS